MRRWLMTQSERDLLADEICGPHCDARVLHAPGACSTCDGFPLLQKARQLWGIAFTGGATHSADGEELSQCPAEQRRAVEDIHRWPGNRP